MASISSDANGTRRLQFVDREKKRRTLYLGPLSMKAAQTIATRVEALVTASRMGTEPDRTAVEWVAEVSDDMADKLVKFGLITARKRPEPKVVTLSEFLHNWFEPRRNAKENTKVVWAQARRNLIEFFGADRDIATITSSEAVTFRNYLTQDQDLGGESVKKRIRVARMFLKEAVVKKLIGENPFASVPMPKSGMRMRQRQEYVPSEVVDRLLPHCSRALRLYVVLARYGGLRCPSETGSLRWADIDWHNLRMALTSPKTESHEGGESRECPIFPRVLDELEAWRAEAPADAVYVMDGLRTQRQPNRIGRRPSSVRVSYVRSRRQACSRGLSYSTRCGDHARQACWPKGSRTMSSPRGLDTPSRFRRATTPASGRRTSSGQRR